MATPRYPIVNGNCFGPASAEIDLRGRRYLGFASLNFSDELKKEAVRGNGSVALGVSVGEYEATCDFELVLHESFIFQEALGNGYGAVPFNIGASYVELPGAGVSVVEIIGATIMKIETSLQRGATGLVDKYTCMVITPIRRNGRTIIDIARGGSEIAAALSLAGSLI